jgi:hypothetical protein
MRTEPIAFGFDEILEAANESGEKREGIHFVGRADFYVYLDFRVSTGGIFYVGKGTTSRAKQAVRRNPHHRNIVKKHRLSRVAFPIVGELEALAIEKRLVDAIGRLDLGTGPLVNTCDGGGAPANFGPDVKARLVANIKAAMADPDVKARQVANTKAALADPEVKARHVAGLKAAMADPDVKARIAANSGMHRPEVKARHAANIKAAIADPDVKARHAAALRGERNPMFGRTGDKNPMHGKTHSPEAIAKNKAAAEERKRIASELGIGYHGVTKAVLSQYRAEKTK